LPKHKSRPDNNFHCFEGIGLSYWRAVAQGLSPAKGRSPHPNLHRGPDGARWEFKQDIDGYVAQNGGMSNPQEIKLSPATYFRFFGTIVHNTKGAKGGMSGGWWIDYENIVKVNNFAKSCNYSLSRAASILLVIPNEWHDCGYLGCALLHKQMKAFVGKGKLAAARISPASAARDAKLDPASMSPAHLEVKQYFVPGDPIEIADAFEFLWVKQAGQPGASIL
jgi:hypothetical protein